MVKMEKSTLDVTVSKFRRCWEVDLPYDANLLELLQPGLYRIPVERIRSLKTKEEQKVAKRQTLEGFTVSGRFSKRAVEGFIEHSGLICLDLDGVEDIETLKAKVCKISFVGYCGRSAAGKGLFVIIPIPKSDPNIHKLRYAALEEYFIKNFGITAAPDPAPKSVASFRFVSYDSNGYFNHQAEIFDELPIENAKHQYSSSEQYRKLNLSSTEKKVQRLLKDIEAGEIDLCPHYDDYFKVACVFANLFGKGGRQYFYDACKFSPKFNKADAEGKFDNALLPGKVRKKKVGLKTFLNYCKNAELDVSDHDGEFQEPLVSWGEEKEVANVEIEAEAKFIKLKPLNTQNPESKIEVSEPTTCASLQGGKSSERDDNEDYTVGIWSEDIEKMERYFEQAIIPSYPVKLNTCTIITDVSKFLDTHFASLKANNGNRKFIPYLDRLKDLKQKFDSI